MMKFGRNRSLPMLVMALIGSAIFFAGSFARMPTAASPDAASLREISKETFLVGDAAAETGVPFINRAAPASSYAGMVPMSDDQLSAVQGQALFAGDKIVGSTLAGAGQQQGTNFTYYRMGLDAEIAMNANIGKMQLGCGGQNDVLAGNPQCDIDLDYVTFLGRNGTNPGAPLSEFILTRPYISIAVRDDNNPVAREVVGIKIGAQAVDGYLGVGRRYTSSGTNLENSSVDGINCDTGAPDGNGVVGCHSGVNSLSGFLSAELSAWFPVTITVAGSTNACSGYNSPAVTADIDAGCRNPNNRTFVDVAGTRMDNLRLTDLEVRAEGGLADWFDPLNARLTTDLRLIHGFAVTNTEDFFISFQRERVAWPRFSKTPPPTTGNQACNGGVNAYATPARCGWAFAVTANTGWWMNVPDVKLVDIEGDRQTLGLFGAFNPDIVNPELNNTPPANCWSGSFC